VRRPTWLIEEGRPVEWSYDLAADAGRSLSLNIVSGPTGRGKTVFLKNGAMEQEPTSPTPLRKASTHA